MFFLFLRIFFYKVLYYRNVERICFGEYFVFVRRIVYYFLRESGLFLFGLLVYIIGGKKEKICYIFVLIFI